MHAHGLAHTNNCKGSLSIGQQGTLKCLYCYCTFTTTSLWSIWSVLQASVNAVLHDAFSVSCTKRSFTASHSFNIAERSGWGKKKLSSKNNHMILRFKAEIQIHLHIWCSITEWFCLTLLCTSVLLTYCKLIIVSFTLISLQNAPEHSLSTFN